MDDRLKYKSKNKDGRYHSKVTDDYSDEYSRSSKKDKDRNRDRDRDRYERDRDRDRDRERYGSSRSYRYYI